MKSVGILGGIGPESTIDYYRGIIKQYRQIKRDNSYPSIYINSIDMTFMLSLVEKCEYKKLVDYLVDSINKLVKCEVDFIAIGSNTPHVVINEVKQKINIPIISIVDKTCEYAKKLNLCKLLLIGTKFTMKNAFYKDKLEKYGISVVIPNEQQREEIHYSIFPELEDGIIVPEKKERLINYIKSEMKHNMIDGVLLGCTELPMMIKDNDLEIKVLNTTQIHIDSIVKELVK